MKCFYFQDRHQRHLWTTLNTKFSFQVIEEKDYPPTANAGEDKVVYLPINQVTLHGNQSSDDHGIVSWEWTLNEGKVDIFWEGHKILRNLHRKFVLSKGQIKSEWIDEIINFPKNGLKNLKDFYPMYSLTFTTPEFGWIKEWK